MKAETLHDLLQWTQAFHTHLAAKLEQCEKQETAERAKMVLGYLAHEEKYLAQLVGEYSESASDNALNTWCYDYLENASAAPLLSADQPLEAMSIDEIVADVEQRHNQLIGLYKHLLGRVDVPSAIKLLKELVSLEEHEAMRVAQATNRFHDM